MCLGFGFFFFFKQKTAYEMRISDWSSDVCSSDLGRQIEGGVKWQPRHGVLITANYYDIVESNRPTNDPLDPINVFQTGKIASKGVEVEEAVPVQGNVELTAAHSYNDAKGTERRFTTEHSGKATSTERKGAKG